MSLSGDKKWKSNKVHRGIGDLETWIHIINKRVGCTGESSQKSKGKRNSLAFSWIVLARKFFAVVVSIGPLKYHPQKTGGSDYSDLMRDFFSFLFFFWMRDRIRRVASAMWSYTGSATAFLHVI